MFHPHHSKTRAWREPKAPSYTGDHSSSVLLDDFCCKLAHLDIDFAVLFSILVRWAIVYVAQMKPLIVPILSEGE
ncbi:hypothetical protein GBA52_013158 [Prunus armeniaca]|nr:hypothetical protein GBA52_013158 [Prunus armeniaca]